MLLPLKNLEMNEQTALDYWRERDKWCSRVLYTGVESVKKEVEQSGCRFRITNRDGVPMIITSDYDTDRVSVHVDEGYITDIYFG